MYSTVLLQCTVVHSHYLHLPSTAVTFLYSVHSHCKIKPKDRENGLTVIFLIFGIPGGEQTCSELQSPGDPSANVQELPWRSPFYKKEWRKAELTWSLHPRRQDPTLPPGHPVPSSHSQYSLPLQSSCTWQPMERWFKTFFILNCITFLHVTVPWRYHLVCRFCLCCHKGRKEDRCSHHRYCIQDL